MTTTLTARLSVLFERPAVRLVLTLAAVLGVLIGLDTLLLHLREDPLADVRAYYDAGARLNAGLPLYEQPASPDDAGFYRYPPLLAIAFRPLAMLPFETAALIWEALLLALFVATLVRSGLRNRWTWLVAGWLAAPIAWSLAVGQAQVAVTFLLILGSPWAVALAAHLKVFPVLLGVFWLGRRDGRRLAQLLAGLVGLTLLSFMLEPDATVAYLGFLSLDQVGEIENRSLYAVSPWLWAGFVVGLAVLAYRSARSDLGWTLAVALATFASPRLFMYQASSMQAAVGGPRPPAAASPPDSS